MAKIVYQDKNGQWQTIEGRSQIEVETKFQEIQRIMDNAIDNCSRDLPEWADQIAYNTRVKYGTLPSPQQKAEYAKWANSESNQQDSFDASMLAYGSYSSQKGNIRNAPGRESPDSRIPIDSDAWKATVIMVALIVIVVIWIVLT